MGEPEGKPASSDELTRLLATMARAGGTTAEDAEQTPEQDPARAAEEAARAAERVYQIVYDELHDCAKRLMRRQRDRITLQTTVLVQEAYLRLAVAGTSFENRTHFLAVAARAMRSVLVDYARRRQALKRGGSAARVVLDPDRSGSTAAVSAQELLELHEALAELGRFDRDAEQLVELRYFGGLDMDAAAHRLGVSRRTAERKWTTARAWLRRELTA